MTPERLNRLGLIGIAFAVVAVLVVASSQFVLSGEGTTSDTVAVLAEPEPPLAPTSTVAIGPISRPSGPATTRSTDDGTTTTPPITDDPTTTTAGIIEVTPAETSTTSTTTTVPEPARPVPSTVVTTTTLPATTSTTEPATTTTRPQSESTTTTTTLPATTSTTEPPTTTTTLPPTTTTLPAEPEAIFVRSFGGSASGDPENWSIGVSVRIGASGPGSLAAQVVVSWDGATPGSATIATAANGRGRTTIRGLTSESESVRVTITSVQSSTLVYDPSLNRTATTITVQQPDD